MRKTYDYKHVWQVPKHSTIDSRNDISCEGWRLWVAPMNSVVGKTFVQAVGKLPFPMQPTLCIPRNRDWQVTQELLEIAYDSHMSPVVAMGLEENVQHVDEILDYGFNILIDVANGYLQKVLDCVEFWRNETEAFVVAGNVNTFDGVKALFDVGADAVRVGIGTGSVCSTKPITGIYRGQVTALQDAYEVGGGTIIADGGIKTSGDIGKAIGAGADSVMLGNLFASCDEAENRVLGLNNHWGQASKVEKIDQRYVEGTVIRVKTAVPLRERITELWDGIASNLSYVGHRNWTDYIGKGEFEILGGR